jgi:TM2 domain-containing membrane protein YozV
MDNGVPQMKISEPPTHPATSRFFDPLAAFLSYLVPGLGQIYQGRVAKGLLFFIGLYILFFYGMWMGQWKNVWIPYVQDLPEIVVFGYKLEGTPKSLAYRPQFVAQFWIGIAAWPAIIQYINYDPHKDRGPYIGKYQRAPGEHELNLLQRKSSKRWDLGWVLTVIAGILNLLVIYDALSGPMIRDIPTRSLGSNSDINDEIRHNNCTSANQTATADAALANNMC